MNREMSTEQRLYRVTVTTTVDHPERRNASFAPVPAGTKVKFQRECRSMREAVSIFEEAIGGTWDFESEFVTMASVTVASVTVTEGWRVRTVRVAHSRTSRNQPWHRHTR